MKTPFFTGSGDDGVVRVGEKKLAKSEPLFDLLGGLDELNSILGWVKVVLPDSGPVRPKLVLANLQEIVFIMQAETASVGFGTKVSKRVGEEHTAYLERVIARVDEMLPPLKSFIVVGGSEPAARLDVARAKARAVERVAVLVAAHNEAHASQALLKCLNRFSSVLFALARCTNYERDIAEEAPRYELCAD